MDTYKKNWLELATGFIMCLLFRLIPLRVPNIEPLMTATMPFSKAYGASVSFFFAFLSIVLYDLVTGTLGKWTLLTSISYGIIGLASAYYFKNRAPTARNFVTFAIMATLFFDAATGLLTGPLFFHQSLYVALVGQVPFTLLHLLGNVSFAYLLSPAIYSMLIKKRKRKEIKILPIISIVTPKTI